MNTYKTSTQNFKNFFLANSYIVEIFLIIIFQDFTQGSNSNGNDSYKSLKFLCTFCALFMKESSSA